MKAGSRLSASRVGYRRQMGEKSRRLGPAALLFLLRQGNREWGREGWKQMTGRGASRRETRVVPGKGKTGKRQEKKEPPSGQEPTLCHSSRA